MYIPLTSSSTHCLDFIFYIKTGFATFLSSLCVISLISLRHFSHLFATFLSSLCVISLISLRHFSHLFASFLSSLCLVGSFLLLSSVRLLSFPFASSSYAVSSCLRHTPFAHVTLSCVLFPCLCLIMQLRLVGSIKS